MKIRFLSVVFTAALTSVLTLFIATRYQQQLPFIHQEQKLPVNYASFSNDGLKPNINPPTDFENAASASVQAVVHIKTQTQARTFIAQDPFFNNDFFGSLFGQRQYYIPPQMGSGSGVVISPDGYIVTNYHVVANAQQVTVTFNDRLTTDAKIISKDPSTDIAVLKVDKTNLPYMEFGNSDDVKLGQWVLAVGYPLTLDATVTAGIVSAKSRAIGINKTQSPSAIESFIQTDAAVNPGNSGGALVNTKGQLIGINSAIASPTGSYAGYSYAIPSNIVQKVVGDLIKYGSVQRGYLGIDYLDPSTLSPEKIKEFGIDKSEGVYVYNVLENGGAKIAGLQKGDFITRINEVTIHTAPQLQEQIARYHPGDNISVSYLRDGKTYNTTIELKNIEGNTNIIKKEIGNVALLGINMKPLNDAEKKKYGIDNGLMVTDIKTGLIASQTNMKKGFIILGVNNNAVNTTDDIQSALANNNSVQLSGFYPGSRGIYYYGIKLLGAQNEQ